jgi:ribose transport system substrate-binding protein
VNATLARHPDLAGIYATATLIGEATGAAIEDADAVEGVHVVAFDASEREVELLQSGGIDELIVQKPYLMGQLGVEAAVAALRGEEYDGPTVTDYVVATADNLDDEEISRWLYSTECR